MKYYLPLKKNSQKVEIETETNSVILIGANGSGKSHLGAWIERQNLEGVLRIGGQRNLNFNENISLKNYSNAMNAVFYGNEIYTTNKAAHRWNDNHLTTTLLNDFESVLSAMISKHNDESREYVDLCSEAEKNGTAKPVVPKRIFDRLKDVWDSIFTQRTIKIKDSKFYASSFGVNEYSATNMSDGERAVLYLASQVLCVPSNKILIIDEPELHLHRSIMYHLWSELEKARPDCLFIYITHDLDFVSSHIVSDIYWVKSYDGNNNWQIEKIASDNVPADLQAEILGSRKPILFVEGEKNSFDTQLYSAVYPNYHVIGCGGCSQVIMRTKAFNATRLSDMPNVFGIIDRDYRCEQELDALKAHNVYTIDVAEVENLFIVEELLRLVAAHLSMDESKIFEKVRKYVVEERFKKQINKQICQSTVAEIKHQLDVIEISKKNDDEAKSTLDGALKNINFNSVQHEKEKVFQDVLQKSYRDVIRVFNEKNLINGIDEIFELKKGGYRSLVLRLLKGEKGKDIIDALMPYMPESLPTIS